MRQKWVEVTRKFYSEFPATFERHFVNHCNSFEVEDGAQKLPKLWKTIGDELIFCCKIHTPKHMAACVAAFTRALSEYGDKLSAEDLPLDVKGSAWTAVFPTENVVVNVSGEQLGEQGNERVFPSEEEELEADEAPSKFDFLGKGIDTGFRLAQFATADQCAISIELAWMLTKSEIANLTTLTFSYRERKVLKGVNGGQPYPVFVINAERDAKRRDVRSRERLLTGERVIEPLHIHDYLQAFMDAEDIDPPFIAPLQQDPDGGPIPAGDSTSALYQEYKKKWNAEFAGLKTKVEDEVASGTDAKPPSSGVKPSAVSKNRETMNFSLDRLAEAQARKTMPRFRLRTNLGVPAPDERPSDKDDRPLKEENGDRAPKDES